MSSVPWWATIIGMSITAIGGYMTNKTSSKDKMKADMLQQTVIRQQQLDDRCQKMMDALDKELRICKKDITKLRDDLDKERDKYTALYADMEDIKIENLRLTEENKQLKSQVNDLQTQLDTFNIKGDDRECFQSQRNF